MSLNWNGTWKNGKECQNVKPSERAKKDKMSFYVHGNVGINIGMQWNADDFELCENALFFVNKATLEINF